ncbi:alpha/beta-hydrolase [Sphaerosporella brunnea]|uniref:Alpha/beta-hydrolase n=1 Tax=Sphaerosporella brunnea TaxID=1250544 RepID=A0A5J5EJ46_9PEZI|nr:alpha/beta-hydrolase [Sphaerosporella brunnea]
MFPLSPFLALFILLAPTTPQQTPHTRQILYLGGHYISTANGTFHHDQIYIEQLTPLAPSAAKAPILLLHGNAQTGTNFLATPDGRPGFADFFLQRAHRVYIADQPLRGRSPVPAGGYPLRAYSAEYVSSRFANTTLWPQARLHSQWPGAADGRRGDPVFDGFYKAQASFEGNNTLQEQRAVAGLLELLTAVREPVVVVSHSQAGMMAWALADAAAASAVKGLVMLEPSGPPFEDVDFSGGKTATRKWGLADVPLAYHPPGFEFNLVRVGEDTAERSSCLLQAAPAAKQLVNLPKIPTMLVTAEASYHALYDHCTVAFLRQAGMHDDRLLWVKLQDRGIRGNGHMMFMELNNQDVFGVVEEWIERL